MRLPKSLLCFVFLSLGCSGNLPIARAPAPLNQDLRQQLTILVQPTHGELGTCFTILENNTPTTCLAQGQAFPMASVFKFPIAITVLKKIDSHQLTLSTTVRFRKEDLRQGRSPIADQFTGDSQTLSIEQLLHAMLVQSDNTAADLLLNALGGPHMVNQMLVDTQIQGIRLDRTEKELGKQYDDSEKGIEKYAADPRDSSTPEAMIDLLRLFHEGRLLSPAMTSHLRALMIQAKPDRIALHLPKGTEVAHKTGTGPGSFNDVGIVELPNGKHLAITLFLRRARIENLDDGSEILGQVAEKIYQSAITTSQ